MKGCHSLQDVMRDFFTICTCITMGTAVFLSVTGVEVIPSATLWQLLLVGLLTTLAGFIYCSRRELGQKAFLLRQILHFLSINAILFLAAYAFAWIKFTDLRFVISFAVLVILVYALISAVIYTAQKQQVKRLNDKLNAYHQRRGDDIE